MRMLPSWALLVMIVIGGVVVIVANSFYPIAKDKEAKERLAKDTRSILLPEVRSNLVLIPTIRSALEAGQIPLTRFDVATWETVSKGGLLLGLKPDEITKFLNAYGIIYRANDLSAKLLESATGIESALSGAANTRQVYISNLNNALTQLQTALPELSQAP